MTYTNIRLFTANGIPEALSNLWYGTDCSVVEIQDAIEDAENAADLLRRIQKMKLLKKVALDRETEHRIPEDGVWTDNLIYTIIAPDGAESEDACGA